MGQVYDGIDDKLGGWLVDQPVFFVGTAPSGSEGHVNVSPKGMAGTFIVRDLHQVAYLDYFGSGAETIAHLRDNGRIVLMFCSFEARCRIVRLHGRGRVVQREDAEYPALRAEFTKDREKGARSVIVIDVERVSDSCGYSVPLMDFVGHRDVLDLHQERKPDEYYSTPVSAQRNGRSIDGLPALR